MCQPILTTSISVNAESGLVLSQKSALLYPGQEFDLSVNNNTGSNDAITRTSSNPEVAKVDEFGHVTAVSAGQAVITVSNGTSSAVCIVAVKERPTQVEDFKLSIDSFSGLKPNGSITVKVEDMIPADVEINQIEWKVYEDDEDWAGLVNVYKDSSDAFTGRIELTASGSSDLIPAGSGYLEVTINGVTRKMTFDWEDLYTSSTQDDLSSDAYYNEQTVYVGTGETATLIAKYMQNHSFIPIKLCTAEGYVDGSYDNPLTDAAGLVLDGPDFSATDVDWSGKLVNKENYALPESIRVFFRYDYGYEYELTQNAQYSGYTYDNTTGVITFRAPSGSGTTVVIRADGVASEGAAAGELSGEVYTRPDGTYGPFDWNLTGGQGKLETAENVNVNYSVKNVAYFTPDAPGVSYITATSKDGKYHVNFAVVSTAVKADVITLNTNSSELNIGDELALTAALSPEPSISDDAALVWVSYNPEVASVDANGVVTAHSAGYAFISVYTAVNNGVSSYCMVKVLPGAEHTHFFGTEWKYDENSHWHECVAEGCDGTIADKAEHTAGDWIVDKEATTEAAGLRHKECTVCHYVMETQVIDKIEKPTEEPTEKPTETPSEKPTEKPSEAPTVEPTAPSKPAAGNIIKTDSVSTDNASKYDFGIANGTSDLMEKVLSDAQKARVANGESAEIFLDVKNITDSVSENDKQLVESVLDKYKVGAYFDISLMMKVGHDKASKVTETSGSISLRIRVPEELTGKALKVVRIHDGAATVIDGTYDENTGYFTFDTDAFSTYALIYAETGMIIAPNTGRENNVFAPIAMVGMIIVAGAAFAAVKRRREESAQN